PQGQVEPAFEIAFNSLFQGMLELVGGYPGQGGPDQLMVAVVGVATEQAGRECSFKRASEGHIAVQLGRGPQLAQLRLGFQGSTGKPRVDGLPSKLETLFTPLLLQLCR